MTHPFDEGFLLQGSQHDLRRETLTLHPDAIATVRTVRSAMP